MYFQLPGEAEVLAKAAHAKTFARTLTDASELGLCTRQRHCWLGLRPNLQQMTSSCYCATGRTASGLNTARKVRVAPSLERLVLLMPIVSPYESGVVPQISYCPLEAFHTLLCRFCKIPAQLFGGERQVRPVGSQVHESCTQSSVRGRRLSSQVLSRVE